MDRAEFHQIPLTYQHMDDISSALMVQQVFDGKELDRLKQELSNLDNPVQLWGVLSDHRETITGDVKKEYFERQIEQVRERMERRNALMSYFFTQQGKVLGVEI